MTAQELWETGWRQSNVLWTQAVDIWISGGWAMIGIAAAALLMFSLGIHIQLKLRDKGFLSVPERTWRRWIDHPTERRGPIGNLLDVATAASSLKEAETVFKGLQASETRPIERDLMVMRMCVTAAPLLGLLGTVTGMLTTFSALAANVGGEKTMSLIAGGISEALITTETGLVIALPGVFFQYQLARKHDRYKAFLAHLESVCNQALYRRLQQQKAARLAA